MLKLYMILSILLFNTSSFAQMQAATPWLGIAIDTVPSGVFIKQITDKSPAKNSKLRDKDIIYKIDKTPVKTAQELIKKVKSYQVGDSVTVYFKRGESLLEDKIKLSARPDLIELAQRMLVNKPAPPFEAVNLKNEKVSSNSFKGKVTILEFWATWCPACRVSMKTMVKVAGTFKDINIVTISDEELKPLRKFFKKQKLDKSKLINLSAKEVAGKYYAMSIPYFVLIDKKGVIRHVQIGAGESLITLFKKAEELNK